MTGAFDLDHTSFAVHDARALAGRLRRELGAVPVAGETLPDFRYVMLDAGARIELIEPVGADGFLTRYLARYGEGPHHLTVLVPDVREAAAAVRRLGLTVTGESLDHPGWREAFVVPDAVHRTVVQLAQSDLEVPTSKGATDDRWWHPLLEVAPAAAAALGATFLGSSDLDATRRLFGDVLGAAVEEGDDSLRLRWPSGVLDVRTSRRPGITGMALAGGPAGGVRIGDARLSPDPHREDADR